jgi:hypothetical protein
VTTAQPVIVTGQELSVLSSINAAVDLASWPTRAIIGDGCEHCRRLFLSSALPVVYVTEQGADSVNIEVLCC